MIVLKCLDDAIQVHPGAAEHEDVEQLMRAADDIECARRKPLRVLGRIEQRSAEIEDALERIPPKAAFMRFQHSVLDRGMRHGHQTAKPE